MRCYCNHLCITVESNIVISRGFYLDIVVAVADRFKRRSAVVKIGIVVTSEPVVALRSPFAAFGRTRLERLYYYLRVGFKRNVFNFVNARAGGSFRQFEFFIEAK